MKKSRGAIGLLQALEEETRKFLLGSLEQERLEQERPESPVHVNIEDVEDESDEEIVFVSKKMRYQLKREESMKSFIEELATEKVLFESLLSDPGASFGFVYTAFPPICEYRARRIAALDKSLVLDTNARRCIGAGWSILSRHTTASTAGVSPPATQRRGWPTLA